MAAGKTYIFLAAKIRLTGGESMCFSVCVFYLKMGHAFACPAKRKRGVRVSVSAYGGPFTIPIDYIILAYKFQHKCKNTAILIQKNIDISIVKQKSAKYQITSISVIFNRKTCNFTHLAVQIRAFKLIK